MKGPLLIASNHPNSFLDAIIISTLFKQPVYALARGDAFSRPIYRKLLQSLNMFPVYRISEGAENLENNYETFEACREIFRNEGIVLIFSEGRCVNEWKLRPLKKGTARLVQSARDAGIPLKVLPLGINYQSFTSFGKNIELNFGNLMEETRNEPNEGFGKNILAFNDSLRSELNNLVFETSGDNITEIRNRFYIPPSTIKRIMLMLPATLGYLVHAPLYFPVKLFARAKGKHNDHYDSLLVGLLFILYPFYLLTACLTAVYFIPTYLALPIFFIFPFCAWSFVQIKKQF